MEKKLKIQSNGRPDDFQTPKEAIDILIPYLKKEWIIWECACGKGNLVSAFTEKGFTVFGTDILEGTNFMEGTKESFDCIITNPPYSLKEEFLKKCYELKKPFALLMGLTALEGKKRGNLFREHGIQLIIPNKRINFETPSGKGSGSWFQTAWFCYGLNLPKDIMFVELKKAEGLLPL